jgi:hypothetical protein
MDSWTIRNIVGGIFIFCCFYLVNPLQASDTPRQPEPTLREYQLEAIALEAQFENLQYKSLALKERHAKVKAEIERLTTRAEKKEAKKEEKK